jgi:hypothetical protein
MTERILEWYPFGKDKQPAKNKIWEIVKTLGDEELIAIGSMAKPDGLRELLKKESCVLLGRNNNLPASVIIGRPVESFGLCFLFGATRSDMRGEGWYKFVKKELIGKCPYNSECRATGLITATTRQEVEAMSINMGFRTCGGVLKLNRCDIT